MTVGRARGRTRESGVGVLSPVKSLLLPKGERPRRVVGGLYRGLTLEIDLAGKSQLYLGLWERETYPYIRRAAARCQWAVDVGAGRGEHCLYLLMHSSARLIYAFEPSLYEAEGLRRNFALNGVGDDSPVRIRNELVGAADGDRMTTLDALNLPACEQGFVKVDVDGAELDVLRGGARLLAAAPVDLLVETHSSDLERDCVEYLTRLGYGCEIIRNAWWRAIVPEHRPIPHNRWLWAAKAMR